MSKEDACHEIDCILKACKWSKSILVSHSSVFSSSTTCFPGAIEALLILTDYEGMGASWLHFYYALHIMY